jgi:ABC-type siderophore export system fused ATPase/permease subunit
MINISPNSNKAPPTTQEYKGLFSKVFGKSYPFKQKNTLKSKLSNESYQTTNTFQKLKHKILF